METEGRYVGLERRLVERYRVNLRARWEGQRVWRDGTVTDISTEGCFILTEDLGVETGEQVRVELLLPAGVVVLWGRVIYKADEIGFGVRFTHAVPGSESRKLELLVKAEALRSKKKQGP